MVFSSLIFIFVFFPIAFSIYYAAPIRYKNTVLLLTSLFFYYWGEQMVVVFLLLSIGVNFSIAYFLEKVSSIPDGTDSSHYSIIIQKVLLVISIVFNLGMLGYFKYSNFFVNNIKEAFNVSIPWHTVLLPIGISFYTFQALSYIVDVYRREVRASKNIIDFGAYLTFFPQLIAGPIVRYRDISLQLKNRIHSVDQIALGIYRFTIGLGKKVLIADTVGKGAGIIFNAPPETLHPAVAWLGAIAYMLQIYFDFSGYSDMAIGLGKIFGFQFLENFNFPYISRSIQEFWRRWHISLSTWFRDYLYIPLGGNRAGKYRTYLNLFIVFSLCGFWHGASWTFLLWGIYYGIFLIVERIGFGRILQGSPGWFAHTYTLLVVIIGWVLFRSETISSFLAFVSTMFGIGASSDLSIRIFLDIDMLLFMLIGIFFSIPSNVNLIRSFVTRFKSQNLLVIGKTAVVLFISLFSLVKLLVDTFNPFLYFRF